MQYNQNQLFPLEEVEDTIVMFLQKNPMWAYLQLGFQKKGKRL